MNDLSWHVIKKEVLKEAKETMAEEAPCSQEDYDHSFMSQLPNNTAFSNAEYVMEEILKISNRHLNFYPDMDGGVCVDTRSGGGHSVLFICYNEGPITIFAHVPSLNKYEKHFRDDLPNEFMTRALEELHLISREEWLL